jgi:hypothetical protein
MFTKLSRILRARVATPHRLLGAGRRHLLAVRQELARDAGMSTAEYAVGTIAACGFAAVLYKVLTSGAVSAELQQLIERALDASG